VAAADVSLPAACKVRGRLKVKGTAKMLNRVFRGAC